MPDIFLLPGVGDVPSDFSTQKSELSAVYEELSKHGRVHLLFALPDIDQRQLSRFDPGKAVERHADAIMGRTEGAPIVVGYSAGGTFAYAICQRLHQRGVVVASLILLDSSPISIPGSEPSIAVQLKETARTSLTAAVALAPFLVCLQYCWLEPARLWLLFIRRLLGSQAGSRMRILLLMVAWRVANRRMVLGRYDQRLALITARKKRPREPDLAARWREIASELEVFEAEGSHWTMIRSEEALTQLRGLLIDLLGPASAQASPDPSQACLAVLARSGESVVTKA